MAVRVAPPPHPGIPHEQSIAAGPGENGGNHGDRRSDLHRIRRMGLDSGNSRPQHRHLAGRRSSRPPARCACAIRTWSRRLPLPRTDSGRYVHRGCRREPRARRRRGRGERAFRCDRSAKDRHFEPGVTEVRVRAQRNFRSCIWPHRGCGGPTVTARRICTASRSRSGPAARRPIPRRSASEFVS